MAANTTQWPLLGFRAMFYLITRAESSYESDKDVPDYVEEVFVIVVVVFIMLSCNGCCIFSNSMYSGESVEGSLFGSGLN